MIVINPFSWSMAPIHDWYEPIPLRNVNCSSNIFGMINKTTRICVLSFFFFFWINKHNKKQTARPDKI